MTAPNTAPAPSRGGRWIQEWDPEDETFWKETGEKVARRNLLFSVLSEHIGFSIWTMWSVMVLFMGPEYGLTPADKFMLTSMVTLVGAVVRVPYTFAVAIFGGRNWTIVSASLLLVPSVAAFAVMKPGTSFDTFLLVGLLAGIGGGNFASSMTNINAFFPLRKKGWALGLNAGGGNIGVPVIQLVALAIIGANGGPRVLLGIYIPLIVVAAVLAAVYMDNIASVKNDTGAARDAAKDAHTWIMSFLYIGTFGSFIGYSFAFGQVLQNQFGRTPLQAAYVTFIGPLLGSLIRPVGGWLADRYGGARITLWNFVAMAGATGVIVVASTQKSLPLFTIAFIALFVLTGLGNGSTYKMIPGIFQAKAVAKGLEGEAAASYGRRLSGASMGLIGAVGALGGVGINLAFRQSFLSYGSGTGAFVAFLAFYALCFLVTWAVYLRGPATQTRTATAAEAKPQLSYVEV
ncbi:MULTISPECIES: nitrate/nitrite transporter [Streptomyces]|jgi:NNP family nitrate/nitrite transporter-like MFS transporter|uniref:Nitrate/nitrite transporter n=1 Tax=Streptomyces mirabilis TaxID=68239 RepID=A0ABU3UST7_9ACTN|nr:MULTISPECIES: nitrate/nitrite transporter [Streptomyces]KAF5996909.1 MFS transporter [Streptomyces sp. WAC00263]MCX4423808.1 NarK/NasA family nitrate transporter [Streptomyces mirabilis]MCX5349634.1 NarK/NasA family nitrate transporter [Streptomyces mirabilis]MCZ1000609.1 NarK/NasA family nitrate transporter [Streptomyces mirabilis]MDU8996986.1 NarK/NasA family nitrate transporter [Streptomyces mirabilis]